MSLYRNQLPQLSGDLFLTDGGIENELIFHHGAQLPYNASYVLLESDAGIAIDEGNPRELAMKYKELVNNFPHMNVLGGCCGTDSRPINEIASACAARYGSAPAVPALTPGVDRLYLASKNDVLGPVQPGNRAQCIV